ncbi:restriction endonuclease subunit S [Phocaeicola dorei]|uniref:restriction endonuclease subunit S n=1 Tax=Phocaeicola dorei TaxID=357276 RepID=UPI001875160B|nr:restriction endonuclease subunit S [Phocaeicola dorei]MBE5078101.1 restriction endonuclease subunit S [Phocaeicola dorei]MBT1306506.1 restriction endonuclease subunit S [Phocaeicola dorei]MBT1310795.1 restriction endonuclease subunit S [Phocaeicola dorei]
MSNTWFRLRRGFFLSFFPSDTPHYENVLPDGWCLTDIGELLINRDGERKPVSSVIRSKQTSKIYDYYGAAGVIDKVDSYLFDERLLLIGEDGANLLSRSKNNAFFAEGRYWVNNHAHVLDATDKNLLDFIAIVINSMKLDDYITGSAQPKLSQDNLNKIPIVLPPLAEQQRIIAEIKKWFTLIDQIEQGKADLQTTIELTKSKILDLAIHGKLIPQDPNDEPAIELLKRINPDFTPCDNGHYTQLPEGWAICKMKQITSITNGKSQKNVETLNGIYPIYGSGGVIGRANQYLCIAGSTIIGRKGTINNPIFVEEHFWNVDTAFGLKANDAILDKYLYYFCLSFDFSKLDKSTAMPSLTKTSIGNVLIPIPPYKEQERIVAKIDMVLDTMNEILRAV